MKTTNPHDIAKLLFALRLTIGAARAVLAEDSVIARPLPGTTIANTKFWDDALSEGKKHARSLLHAAHECAMELMVKSGGRSESEAGALAVEIKEAVEWASQCLNRRGDAPDNDDRIAASHAICAAWHLTAIAFRVFAVEQAFASQKETVG